MKLYRIRNWNELFENNRSRELKNLSWVVVPNKHDGENYTSIITHKHGAAMFSAWVLIIQVASKCDPRGTLLRGNKTPHTPASLSVKTRAPEEWFKMALEYIENQTDWLESEEVAGGCDIPAPRDEEQNRTEQKEKNGNGVWNPTPEQIRLAALKHRRPTTKWSKDEIKAWRDITPVAEEDLLLLEKFYSASIPKASDYRRTELLTLLNHFNGEVDKARAFKPHNPF